MLLSSQSLIKHKSQYQINNLKTVLAAAAAQQSPRSAVGSMARIRPAGTVSFADDDSRNRGLRTAATVAQNVELMGHGKLETKPLILRELYLFSRKSKELINSTGRTLKR